MYKRLWSFLLAVSLLLSTISAAGAASVNSEAGNSTAELQELTGHYAQEAMALWHERGILHGYSDGTVRPNQVVTRSELAAILNRIFEYRAAVQHDYQDVQVNAWYIQDIQHLQAAGIMQGYTDHTFRPNQGVTRQEVITVLYRAFQFPISASAQRETPFQDIHDTAGFARSAVDYFAAMMYIQGADGKLLPQKEMTRGELAVLLNRVMSDLIGEKGVVKDKSYDRHLVVNSGGVTLQNVKINGNLYLTEGIGDGEIILDHVSVTGTIYIYGGGQQRIVIKDASVSKLQVMRAGGKVQVIVTGDSLIEHAELLSGATWDGTNMTGKGVLQLLVSSTKDTVLKGHYPSIVVTVAAKLQIDGDAEVVQIKADDVVINGQKVAKGQQVQVKQGKVIFPSESESKPPANVAVPGGSLPSNPEPSVPSNPNPTQEWKLVWNDEFDGNEIDKTKWGFQLGTGSQYGLDHWGNNEKQYYKEENARVQDGKLIIEAKNDGYNGEKYTSARLFTEQTFTKTYGKFEARIKMPAGQGFWPAFWMMPKDQVYGIWASSGELDIMEARGQNPDEVNGTFHYGEGWPNNKYAGDTYKFPDGQSITDYHTYALEWEPGELRWYVDGNLYSKQNNWYSQGVNQPAKYAYPAPFDQDFYIILNLAVGGHYVSNLEPDASLFPNTMEVDYVRVYDRNDGVYSPVTAEPVVVPEQLPANAKLPVNDNHLYDEDYAEGFQVITKAPDPLTTYDVTDPLRWNLVVMDEFGGKAAASVDTISGDAFAKLDITEPGNQSYAIQMIQNFTIGKGRYYRLSFDGKASAARSMNLKIGGGPNRGYSAYYTKDVMLSDQMTSYEYIVYMEQDTDHLARLELNLGLTVGSVWLGNVRIVEIPPVDPYPETAPKQPLADGNLLYNGSFDLGRIDRLTYWNVGALANRAAASVDPTSRQLYVNIHDGGTAAEDLRITQSGIQLLSDNDYEISFKAKSELPRTITLKLSVESVTSSVYTESVVSIGTDMQEYKVRVSMPTLWSETGSLHIELGGSNADVWLDDIKIVNRSNYIWQESGVNLLTDGSFETSSAFGDSESAKEPWKIHTQGLYEPYAGRADFSIDNQAAKIHVTEVGYFWWHIQLYQNNISLEPGKYKLEFEASSTQERPLYAELTGSGNEKMAYQVNAQSNTFSTLLDVTKSGSYKIMFGVGRDNNDPIWNVPYDMKIDNVRLVKLVPVLVTP